MPGFPDAGNTKFLDSEQEAETTAREERRRTHDGRAKQQKKPQMKLGTRRSQRQERDATHSEQRQHKPKTQGKQPRKKN